MVEAKSRPAHRPVGNRQMVVVDAGMGLRWISLGAPTYTGPTSETEPGVFDRAIFIGYKYVVIHKFSPWVRPGGADVIGDIYTMATVADLPHIARVYGDDVAAKVATRLEKRATSSWPPRA